MPLLPAGNLCIRRFGRTFDGVTESSDAVRYKCRTVATERLSTSVTFRITAALDCDDVGRLVPVTGLRAKGTTIRRQNGFAHFGDARRSSTQVQTRTLCSSVVRWI